MALDNTAGSPTTDSYVSLADANAYHLAHGGAAWDGPSVTDETKEAALRSAVRYLDNTYRGRWKGLRATATQSLAWPRRDVVDEDGFAIAASVIPKGIADGARLVAQHHALRARAGTHQRHAEAVFARTRSALRDRCDQQQTRGLVEGIGRQHQYRP